MADFLIRYPSEEALDAVAQAISGLWVPAKDGVAGHVGDVRGMPGVGEWAMTGPFRWPKPTGATTMDGEGNVVPVMADDGTIFRVFRWNADPAALAPYLALGGGTMTVDPNTGAITITAGPITMESPLPPDCPLTF